MIKGDASGSHSLTSHLAGGWAPGRRTLPRGWPLHWWGLVLWESLWLPMMGHACQQTQNASRLASFKNQAANLTLSTA